MRKSLTLLWLFFASSLVIADDATPSKDTSQRARELVTQLSSESYAQREAAAERLAQLGDDARAALEEGLKLPEAETRLRVRRILSQIEQGEFQSRIDAFLASVDDDTVNQDREHDLPGWVRFREMVGDGLPAREMFVSMLKAEGALLAAAANNPRTAASTFQLRCQQLQIESSAQAREIDAGALAAILFVASDERVAMPAGADSLLYRFCSHSSVDQVLQDKDDDSMMRKVVGAWIASGRGGYHSLRLAMQYELPEGLSAAEKMLNDDTPAYYRQYAILTYAKLGDKEHIPRLMKLLDDATVCTSHQVNNERFETQFRDIALVAVLHLAGYDPGNFGFDRIRPHSQYLYSPYTLGFKDDEERAAAFAKWETVKGTLDVAP